MIEEFEPITLLVHKKTGQITITIPSKYREVCLKQGIHWKIIPQKVWGTYGYEYFELKPIK
jgi:hypothetical protein